MSVFAGLVFFLSGFAALTYQIVWQRLLVIFSGSDVHSATVIVAAFMAGLGCGSLAGGRIADRLRGGTGLLAFAAAELAIAGFGFFSGSLYYDVLYQRLGRLPLGLEARAAVVFVSLLWPTFFMGVSLPLLARALTADIGRAAAVTGMLYGWNTLGAAAGAFATTWWLLPTWGLAGSLRLSAMLNLAAAVVAVPMAIRGTGARGPTTAVDQATAPADSLALPFAVWTVIYGLAGFLALSLEIVWFRLIGVLLKSTAFTFGTLLSVYLTGLGLGLTIGTRLVRRSRRPAHTFLLLQAVVGVYAGLGLTLLLAALADSRTLPWLSAYVDNAQSLDVPAAFNALRSFVRGSGSFPREFVLLYFGLPAVLIGPPTILMGASFPFLQKTVQTDLARLGRRIGLLMMANIAGSALGTIVTGWICIAWFGTSGTLKLLVLVSVLFSLAGLLAAGRRWMGTYAAAIAEGVLLVAGMPDARSLWARLHGAALALIVFGEDGSGVSVLKTIPGRGRSRVEVFANGLPHSWLPYGGIHTVLGALPVFLHPGPREAAVIGLGSGDTLFAIAGRQDLERITCIEIIRPQLATLKQLQREQPYAGLDAILRDPRIDHVYGDGRLHVMRAARTFDLVEADALWPTSAYAGNLYSDAYFALLRDRLKPAGLAVTWAPTARVHDTFVAVFPHVLSYGDFVIGSNEPIAFDEAAIRRRLADPAVQAHYARSGVDILALLAPYLDRPPRVFGPADDRSTIGDINTDLFPKDELGVPRGARPRGASGRGDQGRPPPPTIVPPPPAAATRSAIPY